MDTQDVGGGPERHPDRIRIGGGVVLLSLSGLARDWGVTEDCVKRTLDALGLPTLRFPERETRYVSMFPLECALFELGLPAALKGERKLVQVLHESACLAYGTLTKEVIRERVKTLARELKRGERALTKGPRKPRIRGKKP